VLPTAIQSNTWTGKRENLLKARWQEDTRRQDLEWWRGLFEHVAQSDFLMGRAPFRDGTCFLVALDWILAPEKFAKLLDGVYDNKDRAAAPGQSTIGVFA
jgi:hypothetical protein